MKRNEKSLTENRDNMAPLIALTTDGKAIPTPEKKKKKKNYKSVHNL